MSRSDCVCVPVSPRHERVISMRWVGNDHSSESFSSAAAETWLAFHGSGAACSILLGHGLCGNQKKSHGKCGPNAKPGIISDPPFESRSAPSPAASRPPTPPLQAQRDTVHVTSGPKAHGAMLCAVEAPAPARFVQLRRERTRRRAARHDTVRNTMDHMRCGRGCRSPNRRARARPAGPVCLSVPSAVNSVVTA